MRILSLLVVGVALLTSGCGSMATVTSDPGGASITINGHAYGFTPATFGIRSSTFGTYRIHLEKEGYESLDAVMQKEVFVGRLVVDILFFWPAALINAAGPVRGPGIHHYVLQPVQG